MYNLQQMELVKQGGIALITSTLMLFAPGRYMSFVFVLSSEVIGFANLFLQFSKIIWKYKYKFYARGRNG